METVHQRKCQKTMLDCFLKFPSKVAFSLILLKTIIYRFPNRLFLNGVCPKIDHLYPKVKFPVSRGTPMISPLIKFDHEHNWNVPISNANKTTSFERKVTIDIGTEQFRHLAHHEIDGSYHSHS